MTRGRTAAVNLEMISVVVVVEDKQPLRIIRVRKPLVQAIEHM